MIVILVSDLFEGGNRDEVLRRVAEMTAAGAQVIALLALSDDDALVCRHDNAAALGVLLAAVQGGRHRAGCVVADERGFGDGSGCGRVVCDDTVSVSDKERPSPLPFPEARGGP